MEIFDVFSMNGIENYPAAGEFFFENVILKVSQTHFSKDFYPKGGPMPPVIFQGGAMPPLGGGGVKYPAWTSKVTDTSLIAISMRISSFTLSVFVSAPGLAGLGAVG